MGRPTKRTITIIDGTLFLECTKCHKIKDEKHFNKIKSGNIGYKPHCRECLKEYRLNNKEHIHNRDKEYYARHREQRKKYNQYYRKKNKKKLKEYDKQKRIKGGYVNIHNKTRSFVAKYNIKHDTCCICGNHFKIELHHPDYSKRNEICIVCNGCHKEIHSGYRECPKPINLLDLNK